MNWERTPWYLRLLGRPPRRRLVRRRHNCMGWDTDFYWEYNYDPRLE